MKENSSTYTSYLRVQNSSRSSRKLWIEPWGDEISMPPGVTFSIVAKGPVGDCLEVAIGDSELVVYGWPQSTLAIFQAGELVREYQTPAPSTPIRSCGGGWSPFNGQV